MNATKYVCLLLVGAELWACSPLRPSTPTPLPPTVTPSPTSVAGNGGSGQGCYYTWATQELPETSRTVARSMNAAITGSSGSAYAFGEDCVADDGSRKFLAMETDFRVRIPAKDLTDQTALGDAMATTLHVIENIPPEQVAGPQPGRVEFEFYAPSGESLRLTVEIDQYRSEATGLDGEALFRLFYKIP